MISHPESRRPSDRQPTVVELCGLPGVGKTFVADRLAVALDEVGLAARHDDRGVGPDVPVVLRLGRKGRLVVSRVISQPTTTARALLRIATEQHGGRDAIARSVQWLVTQGLLEQARRGIGVRLLDEGLMQSLWSIGLRGGVDRLLDVLDTSGAWVEPDVVVAVEAPLGTVRRRLGARSSAHSRTQRLPEAEVLSELRRGEELLRRLLDWWHQRRGPEGLIRVCNPNHGELDVRPIALRIASEVGS